MTWRSRSRIRAPLTNTPGGRFETSRRSPRIDGASTRFGSFARDDPPVASPPKRPSNSSCAFRVSRRTRSDENAPCPGAVGWELNPRGRAGPRAVDLGASMDPERLASQAVDLNLKLMRWRLLPELDRDGLAGTRCLLLGAGTLGCAVARCLLAWGVRNITFVDSGVVSFSNPVRQSLFEFSDCLEGARRKRRRRRNISGESSPGWRPRDTASPYPCPGTP